jgi:hypothetical protein
MTHEYLRAQLWQVDEKERRRKSQELESLLMKLKEAAATLDRQVLAEEDLTGIRDPNHFSYSTFAKSARERRGKLNKTIHELNDQLKVIIQACQQTESNATGGKNNNHVGRHETPRRAGRRA